MSADLLARLEATPGWRDEARAAGLAREEVAAILTEAERFAATELAPLAAEADRVGCRLDAAGVVTPPGYPAAYRKLGEAGWIAPDLDEAFGGSGLPLALHVAASLHFEGAAMPFMMAAGASRAGAHLLAASAPELAREWAPALAAGRRAVTIAISEPDAGSDVGRIRTRATPDGDTWRIDGTKCWISFGDHDMCEAIGHLCLARTGPLEAGTRGLSLFLVPGRGAGSGVSVERIEHKLGLHGSPTCVLNFAGARGHIIGEPGRGLPALFAMIELMRLQTAVQGAGIARSVAAMAGRYAGERHQGGDPAAPPVPIAVHLDVRRQLTALHARAALLEALVLDVAVTLAAAKRGNPDAAARAAFLLPIAKNFGGELAFEAASGAIQVLGGAGYTREWGAERHLRDARIITIYEGTTGMQAQDFTQRRLIRDRGAGLRAFLAAAADERAGRARAEGDGIAADLLARLGTLAASLSDAGEDRLLLAADGYLRAGWCAVSAVLACRLVAAGEPAATPGRFWLAGIEAAMSCAEAACRLDPGDVLA